MVVVGNSTSSLTGSVVASSRSFFLGLTLPFVFPFAAHFSTAGEVGGEAHWRSSDQSALNSFCILLAIC